MTGDWRADPVVHTTPCQTGAAWSRPGRIPAMLDGEPCRLDRRSEFRFTPVAFRALAPAGLAAAGGVELQTPFKLPIASG